MIARWTPALATGLDTVDEEHRGLFDLVNELHEIQQVDLRPESAVWILGRLKAYALNHFLHEEALMERIAFPEAEAHRELHRSFIQRVLDLEERVEQGDRYLVPFILDFLKDWLVAHISEQDMRYVGWMRSHPH